MKKPTAKEILENLDQYLPIMPQNYFGDEPGSAPGPTPASGETDDFVPLHATRRKNRRQKDDQQLIDFVMQFVRMRGEQREKKHATSVK